MLRCSTTLAFLSIVLACSAPGNAGGAPPKNPQVVFETSEGSFEMTLFADKAPKSVENILAYVDSNYYSGTIFHRVIDGFMLQGGGFDKNFKKKQTRAPVPNEAANGLKNIRGTVALARTSDPNSATSQFFVNVVDNAFLDHRDPSPRGIGYCVFGEITKGMDVIDKIKSVRTLCPSKSRAPCTEPLPPGMRDVPATPVEIKRAYRKK